MPDRNGTAVCGTLRQAGTRRLEEAESHRLTHRTFQPEDWKETPAPSRRAGADSLTDEEEFAALQGPCWGQPMAVTVRLSHQVETRMVGFYKVTNVAVNRARIQLLDNE